MTEIIQPIPARLKNVAVGGHVAGADQIIDEIQQENQQTINSALIAAVGTGGSVDSRIAAAVNVEKTRAEGAENALDGRVDILEEAVGTGGSVDSRISSAVNAAKSEIKGDATSACDTLGEAEALISAEATRAGAAEVALDTAKANKATTLAGYGITDAYTKSETYSKTEINDHIDTPNQGYVTAIADSNTTTTNLKTLIDTAAGSDKKKTDFIYRVGNWDGTQYDDSVYSEYAWNDSDYIKLSTKSQIGEVYDISANHADTKYADLAAALNGGANIPQSLQKGGMSVKFVQSSDNNYIQYRCIADEFTTDVTKWQGVDAEPSAGNNNLCVSKGILQAIADSAIDELKLIAKITNNLASPNNPTRLNFYKGRTYIISISADNDITGTQLSLKLINPDDSTAIALAGNVLPLGTTKKKFFFSPTQDYIDVRIGSYVEIDSSLLNNRTLIYNISEFPEDINGAYFDGGATPTFDENGMTISMVLPAKMLTLFDERAGQDIQIDLTNVSAENRTYEIVNYNKVVYNRMTNAIQYVPLANKGNYITLLANNGKNITGLLSGYYYNRFKIGTLEAFVNGVQQFVNEETVNISDYPAQSKFTKGSSNGNFWCDRTFHLVKGRSYKITAIPSVDIHNSQSSSAISDGYFSIKIADSSKTTLKALNFASAYAGQPIVLSYIPTQDYNGCYIGSWNDRASESDIQFTIQEIRMHELYHEDIVKTVAVKQYSAFNAIFFSDIHKAENNLVRILEAARIISPDCILNGGDTVEYGYILGNGSQESLDWYNNKIYSAPCDIISALGNHDAWDWSEHAQTGNVKLIPQLTAYNAFTKKVVEKTSDIVQPTNAATDGLNYYYKDYGNVRLIVIDAVYGGNTGTQGPAIPAYITAQNTWFTSVLADAKTNNKTVVCVAHGIDPSYIGGTLTKFGQFNNFLTFGQNYTINGTTVHTHDGFSLNADTMNIVDDFISGGGKFACWLMGHAHFDQTFKLSGHPNQLVFVTSTARYNYHKADGNTDDVASKLYDCFNMFGIIPDLGIIKIMRFGYDTNNTLNNVNSMAYDYVNGNIIQF